MATQIQRDLLEHRPIGLCLASPVYRGARTIDRRNQINLQPNYLFALIHPPYNVVQHLPQLSRCRGSSINIQRVYH